VRPEVVIRTSVIHAPEEVLGRFSRASGSLLARLANNERESRTLATLRDSLLPKLISGQIRVKDAERAVMEVA
jgi:type I restriction enzyme S subunit